MADKSHNLQDTFLNHVRKAKVPLTIFLVNGVNLRRLASRAVDSVRLPRSEEEG